MKELAKIQKNLKKLKQTQSIEDVIITTGIAKQLEKYLLGQVVRGKLYTFDDLPVDINVVLSSSAARKIKLWEATLWNNAGLALKNTKGSVLQVESDLDKNHLRRSFCFINKSFIASFDSVEDARVHEISKKDSYKDKNFYEVALRFLHNRDD